MVSKLHPLRLAELSPAEQRKLFNKEIGWRIAAGELDPERAGAAMDYFFSRVRELPSG
jgi:hypothetical protein